MVAASEMPEIVADSWRGSRLTVKRARRNHARNASSDSQRSARHACGQGIGWLCVKNFRAGCRFGD